jgi:putative photosynthetic complex assembly protein
MSHAHAASFPRAPLIAAAMLVLAALVAVAIVRLTGIGVARFPDAAAAQVRELRFEDRSDGSIAVIESPSGRTVEVVSGEQGFLRGTLRGLARERKRAGLGPEQPFRLIGRADGRLTLEDPATGRRVDLDSFGPTNAGVFARLLVKP